MTTAGALAPSIWDRERLGVTIGAVALIFLGAIEALAVTTVMPVVSEALDGASLYAVAFAGTLATSVIGMVAAGAWADRRGPRLALYVAVALFVTGLLISGFAATMHQFLLGRLVQGLGAGGQTVALYVVVARLYPSQLHGRVFAAFAAAWVVPSMIGPFLAGAVAEFLDWRWAFLGVAALTMLAFLLVAVRLRGVDLGSGDGAGGDGERLAVRMLLASVVAVAAVVAGLSADMAPSVGWPVAALAVLVIGAAILPLLPRGTLRAAPGLPSVVLLRGLIAGAFFAGEAYIPYLLMRRFDFSPTWAGVALMLGALAWAAGSALQGRYGERLGNARIAALSLGLSMGALLGLLLAAVTSWSPLIVIVVWGFGGGGMGLLYPRLTVLTLAYSNAGNQGFNSAALSISDATGSAVTIALAGLGFAALGGGPDAFAGVFAFAAALVLIAAIPGFRLGHAAESAQAGAKS